MDRYPLSDYTIQLLSMSILIFMVSDQMPSTSSFIPLIGWFYTSMMALISGLRSSVSDRSLISYVLVPPLDHSL